MSDHPELPLRLDLSDRRCRRVYLLFAHVLPLPVMLFSSMTGYWVSLGLVLLGSSAIYQWRREFLARAVILHWEASQGWRLGPVGETRQVQRPRALQLGSCLLLEVSGEVFFVSDRSGLNRLRRLLRGGS